MPRRRSRSGRWQFVRLERYQADTKYLDPERAAVLGAVLKLLAVAPTTALGMVAVWQAEPDETGWGEWLVDLGGWGVLGYQLEPLERLVVLRWVDWE
jgi:hypothetical protein